MFYVVFKKKLKINVKKWFKFLKIIYNRACVDLLLDRCHFSQYGSYLSSFSNNSSRKPWKKLNLKQHKSSRVKLLTISFV